MKSKKTAPKKSGVTAFTWFLFSVFLVVSFFCIRYIKQVEDQNLALEDTPIVTSVKQTVPKISPKLTPKPTSRTTKLK